MLEMRQSAGVRDAIITAFLDVLCREGVREGEISKVLAIAGVPESVFYEQFQSKEDLVSAFLKGRHASWMRRFENEIEARYEATGGGLELIADVLQEAFEDPKSLALAFVDVITQSGDSDKDPLAIVSEQKEHLRRFVEQLAVKMGLRHPDMVAATAVVYNRPNNRADGDDGKLDGGPDRAATLSVSSTRLA